jgi:hypothetical protein
MDLTEKIESKAGTLEIRPVAEHSTAARGNMGTRKLCAYNQTRECFLGLEVAAVDLSGAELSERMATLALQSGEGLWLMPFRGIPDTGNSVQLDLIYMDSDCQVIDLVESFPTFRAAPTGLQAASVLALPTQSIYSSQTQQGDQLMLCEAEEMEGRLERFSSASPAPSPVQSAVLLRESPLWSGGPGILQLKDRPPEEILKVEQPHEMNLIEPGMKNMKAPRSWLERWWSPDPRKAPRVPSPGLAAYYWTGSAPIARDVRDISSTGLYVVTEERWYPGTLVLMTIQKTEAGEEAAERSISVHSRAVRWGNDGVGLQFILKGAPISSRDKGLLPPGGVSKKDLERFLNELRKAQG